MSLRYCLKYGPWIIHFWGVWHTEDSQSQILALMFLGSGTGLEGEHALHFELGLAPRLDWSRFLEAHTLRAMQPAHFMATIHCRGVH